MLLYAQFHPAHLFGMHWEYEMSAPVALTGFGGVGGFAGVAGFGHPTQLLHQRAEELPSLQLVLAGAAAPTTRGQRGAEAQRGRQRLPQTPVEQLDLTALVSLQLGDLLHMPAHMSQPG